MASGVIGVKRSIRCNASLWKFPALSNQFLPLKRVTSTTSVSPSQWPTEWPMYVSSGGASTLSRWMVRAAFANVYAI